MHFYFHSLFKTFVCLGPQLEIKSQLNCGEESSKYEAFHANYPFFDFMKLIFNRGKKGILCLLSMTFDRVHKRYRLEDNAHNHIIFYAFVVFFENNITYA